MPQGHRIHFRFLLSFLPSVSREISLLRWSSERFNFFPSPTSFFLDSLHPFLDTRDSSSLQVSWENFCKGQIFYRVLGALQLIDQRERR